LYPAILIYAFARATAFDFAAAIDASIAGMSSFIAGTTGAKVSSAKITSTSVAPSAFATSFK
jgi:hypothetical protein